MFEEKMPSADSQNFKTIRENRGVSLEDLFQKTRVRVVYLQAIENKEFDLLPVPVYARNFIKIYAKALGIDSEPLIKEYEDYLNLRSDSKEPTEDVREEPPVPVKFPTKKNILAIAFILTIVVGASLIFLKQCDIFSASVKPVATTEEFSGNDGGKILEGRVLSDRFWERDSGVPLTETIILTPGGNEPYSSEPDTDLMVITATDETWLRVKADDSPPLEILLKAGEKFEQRAKNISLDIGNAGGIKVKFKDKETVNLGESGEVIHLRLP